MNSVLHDPEQKPDPSMEGVIWSKFNKLIANNFNPLQGMKLFQVFIPFLFLEITEEHIREKIDAYLSEKSSDPGTIDYAHEMLDELFQIIFSNQSGISETKMECALLKSSIIQILISRIAQNDLPLFTNTNTTSNTLARVLEGDELWQVWKLILGSMYIFTDTIRLDEISNLVGVIIQYRFVEEGTTLVLASARIYPKEWRND